MKKVIQIGMVAWLSLIVSCAAHSIDYNCQNDQIIDYKNKVIKVNVDDTNGEIYLSVLLLSHYKGKQFSALYLSQENGRAILVPMETNKSKAGIDSWIIGNKQSLEKSQLVAHYGKSCPLKIIRRLEITKN